MKDHCESKVRDKRTSIYNQIPKELSFFAKRKEGCRHNKRPNQEMDFANKKNRKDDSQTVKNSPEVIYPTDSISFPFFLALQDC